MRLVKAFIASLLIGLLPATPGMSTLQNYSGLFYTPSQYPCWNGFPTYTTAATVAQNTDQHFVVFRAYKTGTVNRIGWVTRGVTTGGVFDTSIQGVDAATGNYDGTVNGSTMSFTIADADDNTVIYSSGSLAASLVKGTLYSANIQINPGSSGVVFFAGLTGNSSINRVFPYSGLNNDGTTFSKSATNVTIMLEYSDGTYEFHNELWPVMNIITTGITTATTPDEMAMKFQIPFPGTYEGMGMFHACAAGATFQTVLYDSDGTTELATDTFDCDQVQGTAGRYVFFRSTNTASISANTNYYLTYRPTSTTSTSVYSIQVSTDVAWGTPLNQIEGGTNVIQSTRTDAGSWGDVANRRPLFTVGIKAFDDAAGGSGGGGKVFTIPF